MMEGDCNERKKTAKKVWSKKKAAYENVNAKKADSE
jgi:hypothetical protein